MGDLELKSVGGSTLFSFHGAVRVQLYCSGVYKMTH
jgi:hypothetical protein